MSGSRNGGHTATRVRSAPTAAVRSASRTSLLLPIPASPSTSTRAGGRPRAAVSRVSSTSRPTNRGLCTTASVSA
ncbi:MAG TPA: hypothetical protein VHW44_29890 [Pseudonocardiaceae bacterium]|nr:hypothetical protein [Pseudonocardiaceae bacterium]